MTDVSTVNADQVVNVEPQEGEKPIESANGDVATPQEGEKPKQSPEENAKFAEIRREAERKARDKTISEMGMEWNGKPITTYDEYQKALAESKEQELLAQMKSDEVDPQEILKQLKENDPEIKQLREYQKEVNIKNQISELNAELKDLGIEEIKSIDDIAKLESADRVITLLQRGYDLKDAYLIANKDALIKGSIQKTESRTIAKVKANEEASPGSLSNNGQSTTLFT